MIKGKATKEELERVSSIWLDSRRTSIYQFLEQECFDVVEKSALEKARELKEIIVSGNDIVPISDIVEVFCLYEQAIVEAREDK